MNNFFKKTVNENEYTKVNLSFEEEKELLFGDENEVV